MITRNSVVFPYYILPVGSNVCPLSILYSILSIVMYSYKKKKGENKQGKTERKQEEDKPPVQAWNSIFLLENIDYWRFKQFPESWYPIKTDVYISTPTHGEKKTIGSWESLDDCVWKISSDSWKLYGWVPTFRFLSCTTEITWISFLFIGKYEFVYATRSQLLFDWWVAIWIGTSS